MNYVKKYGIPILVVVILLWLPFYQGDSKTTIEQMQDNIVGTIDQERYVVMNEQNLRKYFNINPDEIEGYIAYKAKDTMSAETLLIIKIKDKDTRTLKDKIEKYVQAEHKKYDGYSIDQIRILDNYTMIDKKGYILLSIADHDNWKDLFLESL